MDDDFRVIERAWRASPGDQELRERLRKARQRRWGFDPYDPICRAEHLVHTTTSTNFVQIPGLDISEEIARRPSQSWLIMLSAFVSAERSTRLDNLLHVYAAFELPEREPRERLTPQVVARFSLHGDTERLLSANVVVNSEPFSAVWRADGGVGAIRARTIVAIPLSPVEPSGIAPVV